MNIQNSSDIVISYLHPFSDKIIQEFEYIYIYSKDFLLSSLINL